MDINKKYFFLQNDNTIQDEHIIVYDLEDNIIVLNEFECTLIRMFDGKNSISQISHILSEQYGASYCEEDFLSFACQLLDLGVIKPCD